MKTWIITCMLLSGWIQFSLAQTHTEKLTKEFAFEKPGAGNTLMVSNISGSVKVSGYEGDKVIVEVTKTITAKTEARLERGKRELSLGVIDRADTIILYINGLCSQFGQHRKSNWGKYSGGWGYNWNGCHEDNGWHKDEGYDYKLEFTIKVPDRSNVVVSTVNKGEIMVERVVGSVVANNVNGGIKLTSITGPTNANTINGDVDLDYTRNPEGDCRYYTLNGDINANFKKGLAADLSFETFNGSLYTNVSRLESLPGTLEKKIKGEGVTYKLGGNRYKVGDGGVLLDFETFNGNVYLKEN
jgi:hypothetical protein